LEISIDNSSSSKVSHVLDCFRSYKTGYRRSGLHERRILFDIGGSAFPRGEEVFPRRTKKIRRSYNLQKKLRLGSNRRPMGILSNH